MEASVMRFFADLHINVKAQWLYAAVAFLKSHGRAEKEDDLCQAVFEQFIHSDLSITYEPLAKVPTVALKAVIVKPMIFQNADDLSWFHGDEDEPQKSDSEQQLRNSGSRRLLKMKLSDGQNVVHAIEYGEKLTLDENTLPGTKILLKTRVLLRRGILLLNPGNCQVLGGDNGNSLNLAVLFAERVGIKHDVKRNCRVLPDVPSTLPLLVKSEEEKVTDPQKNTSKLSTISPFLVRVPRISNQLLHNPETDAQETIPKTLKKEIYDVERTAIVPPLQSIPSVIISPIESKESEKMDDAPRMNVQSNVQIKQLLPVQNSETRFALSAPAPLEDLPIPTGDLKLIPHEMVPPAKHRKTMPNDGAMVDRSISNFFAVSRQKDIRPPSKLSGENCAKPIDSVPVVPLWNQRSVAGMNKTVCTNLDEPLLNGERYRHPSNVPELRLAIAKDRQYVSTKSLRSGTYDQSISPTQRRRTSPTKELPGNDSTPSTESLRSRSIPEAGPRISRIRSHERLTLDFNQQQTPSTLQDDYNRDFSTTDHCAMISTQEMLNPSCTGPPLQDPDFISFMEESLSDDVNTDVGLRSPPRNDQRREVPSTAVVPFKRIRSDMLPRHPMSNVYRQMSKSPLARKSVMEKFIELKVVRMGEAFAQRKFWMLPKRLNVMGICHIKGELSAKHGLWLLEINVTDESVNSQTCEVDPQLLEKLLGFSVKHCERMSIAKNSRELSRCKERALEVMKSFQRLDLVLALEVHPQKDKLPLVLDVRTLAEAIEAC
ncbi:hypothetical protein GCK32_001828 [Trichostrongylus colubriformis]|uniref:RecQ-mediated genome instability protein 1 n=1 Tax=Trichostrongylus colubriformis TaxID=6319 RepID=A0AAN8FPF8_TRICO